MVIVSITVTFYDSIDNRRDAYNTHLTIFNFELPRIEQAEGVNHKDLRELTVHHRILDLCATKFVVSVCAVFLLLYIFLNFKLFLINPGKCISI